MIKGEQFRIFMRCSEIPATLMPSACQEGFRCNGWRLHVMYEALRDFAHQRFHVNPSLWSGLREAASRCVPCKESLRTFKHIWFLPTLRQTLKNQKSLNFCQCSTENS
jgi:hypothetical protein